MNDWTCTNSTDPQQPLPPSRKGIRGEMSSDLLRSHEGKQPDTPVRIRFRRWTSMKHGWK